MPKRSTALAATVATFGAMAVAVTVGAPAASADPSVAGTYNPLPVERIVNTTTGTGAPKTALAPGQTLSFDGTKGIDGTVGVLDLTVTAITPARNGFLTAYSGTTRPGLATLTFTAGESTPNDAAVTVSGDGTVTIYNGSPGTVQLAVDRNGYWTGGEYGSNDVGLLHPLAPTRVVDSRTTKKPVAARSSVAVPLAALDLPTSATQVAVNITAVTPKSNGYLTSFPVQSANPGGRVAAENPPGFTSVSFTAARTRSNYTVAARSTDGNFRLYNGAPVAVDYTVDVVGYFTSGEQGDTSQPSGTASFFQQRFADSRRNGGPIAAKGTSVVPVGAPDYVQTITVNVTATGATASGYLTAWNGTSARPISSVTNFYPGTSRTGTITVPVVNGGFTLYNGSTAPVGYTVDIVAFTVTNIPPANNRAEQVPARGPWVTR